MKRQHSNTKRLLIRADELKIHPRAQRALSNAKIEDIIENFDYEALGTMHTVYYKIKGILADWVVDGQHRTEVLQRLDCAWKCDIMRHVDVTDDAAACALFLKLNNKATVNPFDKFDKALGAGDPAVREIVGLLRKNGLAVGRQRGQGKICCVSTLRKMYELDQGRSLGAAIATSLAAWGSEETAREGRLLEGLALFYRKYDFGLDDIAVREKLAKHGTAARLFGVGKHMRESRLGFSLGRCIAQAVVDVYNEGRRTHRLQPYI